MTEQQKEFEQARLKAMDKAWKVFKGRWWNRRLFETKVYFCLPEQYRETYKTFIAVSRPDRYENILVEIIWYKSKYARIRNNIILTAMYLGSTLAVCGIVILIAYLICSK